MKTLIDVLTPEETAFVMLVYKNPCAKLNSGEAVHCIDDGSQYGQTIALWENPEKLGLIESVGSYKWRPTNKLQIGIVSKENPERKIEWNTL